MISGPALLPCPFCGGEAERVDNGPTKEQVAHCLSFGEDFDGGGSFIHCKSCDASTALHFERRENLVSSWNDRRGLDALKGAAEAAYNSWFGGDLDHEDMKDLARALGIREVT